MSELTPVRKERIQSKITRIVLQDEGREKLDQVIEVNEVDEVEAQEMIRVARKQRIDAIRSLCMKNIYIGSMVMILGVAVIYSLIIVMGNPSRPIWAVAWFILLLGIWKLTEGVVGIAMAGSRKGPVETE
ncbi:MAG: hypothetical protein P1V20_00250 [Verrucomicrobiales bacterium]|nr:hypothetical protein [Verrucomicrobiales bacterium]